jgi:hypothetical protein
MQYLSLSKCNYHIILTQLDLLREVVNIRVKLSSIQASLQVFSQSGRLSSDVGWSQNQRQSKDNDTNVSDVVLVESLQREERDGSSPTRHFGVVVLDGHREDVHLGIH